MDSASNQPRKLSLLVVEDEPDLLDLFAESLRNYYTEVIPFRSIQPALDYLAGHQVDLILSDIRMPGGSGFDLIQKLKTMGRASVPVVLITGFLDTSQDEAIQSGASAVVHKPYRMKDVLSTIESVLEAGR